MGDIFHLPSWLHPFAIQKKNLTFSHLFLIFFFVHITKHPKHEDDNGGGTRMSRQLPPATDLCFFFLWNSFLDRFKPLIQNTEQSVYL